MGLFKKGYNAVREEKQRQDENREKIGKRLWKFFLSDDGDEAEVHFLTEEPINFYEHTIKVSRGGKDRYDSMICTQNNCPYCKNGDRPSFKGAYLIYDKRPYEYKDKDGKKQKGKGQLRLYVQGAKVLSQLDRLSSRYGLTNRDYTITRTGSGTSTSYMFDRGEETGDYTRKQIESLLPDKLRDEYDGSMDSLYSIIEAQLEMSIEAQRGDTEDDGDDEEDDDTSTDTSKNLVGADDDDEEEEEESPRKKPVSKLSAKKKVKENSAKSLFKKKKVSNQEDDDNNPF